MIIKRFDIDYLECFQELKLIYMAIRKNPDKYLRVYYKGYLYLFTIDSEFFEGHL